VCFTINNPEVQLEFSDEIIRYAVWQQEIGEQGTPHYQGYIEATAKLSLPKWKLILGNKAHIEARKGTRDQARDYCMKSESKVDGPWEYGKWSGGGQGSRSDLKAVAGFIMGSAPSLREAASEFPETFIRFHRGIEKLVSLQLKPRDPNVPPVVTWIYGPTGVGKTKKATTEYGASYYMKDNTMWWDGYEQQETIIMDDIDDRIPFRVMLQLLDRYPYQGQVKGGYVHINSKNIVITADRPLEDVYSNLTEHEISQLKRRINFVIFLRRGAGAEVAGNTRPPLITVDDF